MDTAEKHDHRLDLRRRGEAQQDHRVERGGRLRGFAAGAPEAGDTVGAGASGSLGDAEVRGEEGAAELVGQGGVAARERPGDGFAAREGFAGDEVDVEAVVRETGGDVNGGVVEPNFEGEVTVHPALKKELTLVEGSANEDEDEDEIEVDVDVE